MPKLVGDMVHISELVRQLKVERYKLDQAIAALEGDRLGNGRRARKGPRRLSAAAKARISAAQKLRWAKQRKLAK
jgi:hypothetical protein